MDPQDDLAGHLGALHRVGSGIGEVGDDVVVIIGKRNHAPVGVQGVDQLQHADHVAPVVLERDGEHGPGTVAGHLVIVAVERKGVDRINAGDVRDIEDGAVQGDVAGYGTAADGNCEGRIGEFAPHRQPTLHGVVLGVTELEQVPFLHIDGTGVAIGEAARLCQYLLQKQVDILDL